MSLLDDDKILFDETDLFIGFPYKEDCVYKHTERLGKRTDDSDMKIVFETYYYNCTCPFFKMKYYMPYGFRIAAVKHPVISRNKSATFALKIVAIDDMDIRGPYMDDYFGYIPYEYKNEIPNILYDFIKCIKKNPVRFLEMYEAKANWMGVHYYLRDFFEIEEKYKFIAAI